MNDIRDKILSTKKKQVGYSTRIIPENHPAAKGGHTTLPVKSWMFDEHIVKLSMDEYALLVLEYVRKDYNFSETYITDLKSYLEEIKKELKP